MKAALERLDEILHIVALTGERDGLSAQLLAPLDRERIRRDACELTEDPNAQRALIVREELGRVLERLQRQRVRYERHGGERPQPADRLVEQVGEAVAPGDVDRHLDGFVRVADAARKAKGCGESQKKLAMTPRVPVALKAKALSVEGPAKKLRGVLVVEAMHRRLARHARVALDDRWIRARQRTIVV